MHRTCTFVVFFYSSYHNHKNIFCNVEYSFPKEQIETTEKEEFFPIKSFQRMMILMLNYNFKFVIFELCLVFYIVFILNVIP